MGNTGHALGGTFLAILEHHRRCFMPTLEQKMQAAWDGTGQTQGALFQEAV